MTMLSLLPVKPPGVTAQWLRDQLAMHHDGFGVTTRTVERNLDDLSGYFPITRDEDVQPFRWYWMPRANPQVMNLAQRVATEGGRPRPTPVSEHALSWRPAEEFARALKVPTEQVVADIQAGTFNGVLLNGLWYVLDLVALDYPDTEHPECGRLRIAARRDGNRLTAGNDVLELNVTYDHDAVSEVLGIMINPVINPDEHTIPEWLPVKLGDTTYEVDRTLQNDLVGTLLVWQVQVELGDLLKQYQPEPDPTEGTEE
jgi:hypothetical protein